MINTPLNYLDYDVTTHIYQTYFPSDIARKNKKFLNKEFITNINNYKTKFNLQEIYDSEVVYCVRGSLYKRICFLSFFCEKKYIKAKYEYPYLFKNILLRSHDRANQYKNEALHLKKIVNHIL